MASPHMKLLSSWNKPTTPRSSVCNLSFSFLHDTIFCQPLVDFAYIKMSHLLSPIGSPSSCYDFDTTQFAVIMPNNELNTDIDSIPYPLSLQPIIMDPITTLNIENPVPLPTSISSSLPLLQTSSARSFSSSSDTATKSTVKRRSQVKNACG
ncbi:hypothetical protein BD408DRAFT_416722, partial [Parasitella parasitica]